MKSSYSQSTKLSEVVSKVIPKYWHTFKSIDEQKIAATVACFSAINKAMTSSKTIKGKK